LGACAQWREAAINFPPVRLCAVATGRTCVKFDIQAFYENTAKKFKFG
jgi:hypothetical protein